MERGYSIARESILSHPENSRKIRFFFFRIRQRFENEPNRFYQNQNRLINVIAMEIIYEQISLSENDRSKIRSPWRNKRCWPSDLAERA